MLLIAAHGFIRARGALKVLQLRGMRVRAVVFHVTQYDVWIPSSYNLPVTELQDS